MSGDLGPEVVVRAAARAIERHPMLELILVGDEEQTLKEIGEDYNLSRERIRQLQEQALGKIRQARRGQEIL